jgi:hypothetical protein
MTEPLHRPLPRHLSLAHLQRVKKWHLAEQAAHPLEYHLWDIVLTIWLMGWIGCVPAFAFDAPWAYPLCALGVMTPRLYVRWRARAHEGGRLRCDWLDQLA